MVAMGATPDEGLRTALNAMSEEWETFVQGILGRATLPNWKDMWAALRQEERIKGSMENLILYGMVYIKSLKPEQITLSCWKVLTEKQ